MEEITGFRCHIKDCKVLVPGHINELKLHYKNVHGLNTTANSEILFRCSECSISYSNFRSLKRHLLTSHPEIKPPNKQDDEQAGPSSGFMNIERNSDEENEAGPSFRIPERKMDKEPIPHMHKTLLMKKAREYVTTMRTDPALPESKIQAFMVATAGIMEHYFRYTEAMVKQFLDKKSIPMTDKDSAELLNNIKIDEMFEEVKTPKANISYLALLAGAALPEPTELVLGKRKEQSMVDHKALAGRKPKLIRSIRVVKDTAHYIPITETLSLILRSTAARQMIANEGRDGGDQSQVLTSFRNGHRYQDHSLLKNHPETVRLCLHLDDVEYVNPLGSRRTKQKMTMISFKIENMHPAINASPSRIYLAMAVRSKDVKKYGYKAVLQPMLDDLLALQSEDGVKITVDDGTSYTLRAMLCHVVGDTLAMHEVFELLSPSATLFCRACYATKPELHTKSFGIGCTLRTVESVRNDVLAVQEKTKIPKECGIVGDCVFHTLPHFNIVLDNTFDPMHDLLEGVVKSVLGDILKLALKTHKTVTIAEVNTAVETFYYGPAESHDKPTANFKLNKEGAFVSQSAAQTWLLLRAFPFIFKNILTFGEQYSQIVSTLLRITYFSFSDKLQLAEVDELQKNLDDLYRLYPICFPNRKAQNKLHHLSHYPKVIRQHGPIVFFSCMLYEMKFKESKAVAKTCNNYKNITYSFTKRLNLRQIQTIINHEYTVGKMEIVSSKSISRNALTHARLFCDLPDAIRTATHVKINNTSFKKDSVVNFIMEEKAQYGIIDAMVVWNDELFCAIKCLDVIQFCNEMNSFKVSITSKIVRVEKSQLSTKKTYSLWSIVGESGYYVSLKYNEW